MQQVPLKTVIYIGLYTVIILTTIIFTGCATGRTEYAAARFEHVEAKTKKGLKALIYLRVMLKRNANVTQYQNVRAKKFHWMK